MAQYIDKSTLVAEIEKLGKEASERLTRPVERSMRRVTKDKAYVGLCRKILDIIDTLEVKEVDLEKEYKDFVEEDPVYNKLVNGIVGKAIAKHFFELGLKAQKGEEV